MITLYAPYTPQVMRRDPVFSARQYPRQAFDNLIDPVLNIDWFDMRGPTFPAHPHAGFSAVTYLFADSPNGFMNRDSLGETHPIRPGGLHWSRASRGMIHEETPIPGQGPVRGLQIFLNLPAADQSSPAAAFPLAPEAVAIAHGEGWRSRTAVDGTRIGAFADALPAPVLIEEVALDRQSEYRRPVPGGWGGIVIALEGTVSLSGHTLLGSPQAAGFAARTGSALTIGTLDEAARVAIVGGQQLHQPVYARGPLMLASAAALESAATHVSGLTIPPRSNAH